MKKVNFRTDMLSRISAGGGIRAASENSIVFTQTCLYVDAEGETLLTAAGEPLVSLPVNQLSAERMVNLYYLFTEDGTELVFSGDPAAVRADRVY